MVRKSSTIHASENQIGKISIGNDKNGFYLENIKNIIH